MKNFKIFLLSFCIAAGAAAAYAADFPKPAGWVSDYAGAMDEASRGKTEAVIRELEQKTSAEIAVVTIRKLEGGTVESYAAGLLSAWGVGKKGKDNGVLILAAIEDRRMRIEAGYGLEGILTDGKTGAILDRYVVPQFKAGNYGEGLFQGTLAVASVIAKDAGVEITGGLSVEPERPRPSPLKTTVRILFLIILFFIFIRNPFLLLLLLGGGGRGGGGGGFGGGFGGFGGGSSGGGGASRGW